MSSAALRLFAIRAGLALLLPWLAGCERASGPNPRGTPNGRRHDTSDLVIETRPPVSAPARPAAGNADCRQNPREAEYSTCCEPAFRDFLDHYVRDASCAHPAFIDCWRDAATPFVPCIIKSLQSDDACTRLAAVNLLDRIADPRAVEPLVELLRNSSPSSDVAIATRRTLSWVFRNGDVVPFLAAAISSRPPGVFFWPPDIDTATVGTTDPRIFEALSRWYDAHRWAPGRTNILGALVYQKSGPRSDRKLREVFGDLRERPGCVYQLPLVIQAIASPATFDEIEEYYFSHFLSSDCERNPSLHCLSSDCEWNRVEDALRSVGGTRYMGFLRKAFTRFSDAQLKASFADKTLTELARTMPSTFPAGHDSLDWLRENASEFLPYATEGSFAILLSSADAKPDAVATGRAAYWEKAATLFMRSSAITYRIQYNLYQAYGPEGTDEPEKCLKALTAAIDGYTSLHNGNTKAGQRQPSDWVRAEAVLKQEIAVRSARKVVRIVNVAPLTRPGLAGPWKGELVLPADQPSSGLEAPIGFVDFYGPAGLITSAPADTTIDLGHGASGPAVPFVLHPHPIHELQEGQVTGVRLRLLFVPGRTGFSGAIVSDIFTLH